MGCFDTLSMTASFLDIAIIIKLVASAFPLAYSWIFDPSLVSHSSFPKSLSDGEHKEPLIQGSNTNN
jgi:hypothetical protein